MTGLLKEQEEAGTAGMQYFESTALYENLPSWAAAVLGLGYRWARTGGAPRRIGLLSMPCDSEAAGLIALGALRRDLESRNVNYEEAYFEVLLRACRERAAPQKSRFQTTDEHLWDVRNTTEGTRWRFAGHSDDQGFITLKSTTYRPEIRRKGKVIANPNSACTSFIFRRNALNWQLRNGSLPQLPAGGTALASSVYNAIPGCCGTVWEANLSQSHDGLVLVGRGAARESVYMRKFIESGFALGEKRYSLAELLTLHHDDQNRIRRLRFLNEQAHQDDTLHAVQLVVADGISGLLQAIDLFPFSDIIGICNRDAPPEAVRQLRERLSEISRYYSDTDPGSVLTEQLPAKILLRLLQRRE